MPLMNEHSGSRVGHAAMARIGLILTALSIGCAQAETPPTPQGEPPTVEHTVPDEPPAAVSAPPTPTDVGPTTPALPKMTRPRHRLGSKPPLETPPAEPSRDNAPPPDGVYAFRTDGAHVVRVFYATDRRPIETVDGAWNEWKPFLAPTAVALIGAVVAWRLKRRHRLLAVVAAVGLAAVVVRLVHTASIGLQKQAAALARADRLYGSERHESWGKTVVELGECEVSLPPDHRVGMVESPSVLKLEFSENPAKHVVLQRVRRLPDDEFFRELRTCVEGSARKQTFVFIHGYNVSFDDAVRRTAQIAFDLRFDGAPICYSWPSLGGLASYTRDESNIAWTVLHLESFLKRVSEESGAQTVHLVAHSMGNRALTAVLERMALRGGDGPAPFGQIVLAAPDVDASEFRDRFAPAIARMARRATLYASSNDRALLASTKVHGYTRAGLSGEHLVAVAGIDTIDASPIDTSLIGHSYYGDNPQLIRDLRALVDDNLPAENREWLEKILGKSEVGWWVFRANAAEEPPAEL